MATVEEYGSGRVLRHIRLAHIALGCAGIPLAGPVIARNLERRMQLLGIRPITLAEAGSVIDACGHCAAGPRICQPLFPQSVASEAVFLDELADRLAAPAGRARPVTKEQAKALLAKYPDNPLILSRVSGRYLEICRSDPRVCVYWKMRRGGLNV
jgi:hypothetical protein